MGPRPIGRGNLLSLLLRRGGQHRLQWGRDQLVAEIWGIIWRAELLAMLQWGRDQLVAEIRAMRGANQRAAIRFNGAATNWSRKYGPGRREGRGRRASMGPRPIGRGNTSLMQGKS